MELNCWFGQRGWNVDGVDKEIQLYTCFVSAAKIDEPGTVIRAFNGAHYGIKSLRDVEALEFYDCKAIKHFPRGVQNPRIRCLKVKNCGLKTIARSDLDGLQSLETLQICNNQLKSLPSNLLVGMSKLKIIDFMDNQIESMSSDILKPVMKNGLKLVDFEYNGNLNAFFQPGHPKSAASIEDLMKIIEEKCTKPTNGKPTAPDQQDLNTKAKDSFATGVSGFWESEKFADFTVNAGSKKFRVHKLVLATQSTKFAEMFEEQEVNEMSITDLDEVVVEAFLRYLYTGDVPNDVDFIRLFGLSSKLGVAVLTTYCEEKILSNLGESNAFEAFRLGHTYCNEEFKQQAFEEIRRMFPDVEMSESLVNDPEKLKKLIEAQQYLNSIKAEFKIAQF